MATLTKAWGTGTGSVTLTYTGQGNETVTITSDPNNLFQSRSMTVTVKTTDNAISHTVTITQAARVIQYFYVLHTSTQVIEKIELVNSFDITSLVASGKVYGGYGSEFRRAGDYATVLFAGGGEAALHEQYPNAQFVDGKLQDNGTVYTGNELTPAGAVRSTYYYTSDGRTMTPVADTLYTLIELDNKFLTHYFFFASDSIDSNDVVNAFGIFGVLESGYYSSIKFIVDETDYTATTATSYTFSYTVDGTSKTYQVKPTNFGVTRGFIAVTSELLTGNAATIFQANTRYQIQFVVTTKDGVEINADKYIILETADFTSSHMSVKSAVKQGFIEANSKKFITADNKTFNVKQ